MYFMHKPSGSLVEVPTLDRSFDPFRKEFGGRLHAGDELQEPAGFDKAEPRCPSGEMLPRRRIGAGCKTARRGA